MNILSPNLKPARLSSTTESPGIRYILLTLAFILISLLLILPLAVVFIESFSKGIATYFSAISHPDALAAVKVTLTIAAVVVPLNTLFGVAAAWCIARFEFPGRQALLSAIDLPFSVSPVVSGLVFVLLFGAQGLFGSWLKAHDIQIIFALPGIFLATLFVTLPFVARELIPLMQSLGREEEEAALALGASGWQMFFKVTLPNIRWGLIYGIILCNARTMGEFGAVSVVSGHIRGETNSMPLHVEILYNEYQFAAAFAVSSLLVCLALLTLAAQTWVERQQAHSVSISKEHRAGADKSWR